MEREEGKIIQFALSIHNPLIVDCDIEDWQAYNIFGAAAMKVTGKPYESQEVMYLYEQRRVAKAAYKILKSLRYDKETIVKTRDYIERSAENETYTKLLTKMFIGSGYDCIVYKNEFEATEDEDPTCYIVFQPNQVKSIEPTYEQGMLIDLS